MVKRPVHTFAPSGLKVPVATATGTTSRSTTSVEEGCAECGRPRSDELHLMDLPPLVRVVTPELAQDILGIHVTDRVMWVKTGNATAYGTVNSVAVRASKFLVLGWDVEFDITWDEIRSAVIDFGHPTFGYIVTLIPNAAKISWIPGAPVAIETVVPVPKFSSTEEALSWLESEYDRRHGMAG